MGRKKTGSMPTNPPKQKKKMIISMTEVELAKSHMVPGFRTGKYMVEKDRPRKKDWKREYGKKGRESGDNKDTDSFLFDLPRAISRAHPRQLRALPVNGV